MRKLVCLFVTIISVLAVLAYLYATPDDTRQMKPIDDIDGYKVKFDYEGHQEIRDRVYKFIVLDDKYPIEEEYRPSKYDFGIDLYDIDGDGKDEVLIYISNIGYCGSAGCSFKILKQKDNSTEFDPIFNITTSDYIMILRNKNLDVSDILLGGDILLLWDGKRFESDRSRPEIGKKEGYKIKFDYKAHEKERQMVYDYMAKDYKKRIGENLEMEGIGIDLFDVDGDGKDEIFVYLNEPNYCARSGCSFDILKRVDDSFPITVNSFKNMITTFLDDKDEVFVLKDKNLGIYELMLRSNNLWQWQGSNFDDLTNKNASKIWEFERTGDFYEDLAMIESARNQYAISRDYEHLGLYQMDKSALIKTGYYSKKLNTECNNWTGKNGIISRDKFLSNQMGQLIAAKEYHNIIWDDYFKDYHKYVGQTINGVELTKPGMIAAVHFMGYVNMKRIIKTGITKNILRKANLL